MTTSPGSLSRPWPFWRRMSFRIAATIIVALLATQALNFLFFRLTPPPQGRLFAARATAHELAKAAQQAFAAPAEGAQGSAREEIFSAGEAILLDPQWAPFLRLRRVEDVAGGWPLDGRLPPDLRRFFATLLALAPSVREIRLLDNGPPFPMWRHPGFGAHPPGSEGPRPGGGPEPGGRGVIFVPSSARPTALTEDGALRDDEPEWWFPGPIRFALRGPDDHWLVVEDVLRPSFWDWRTLEPLLWLLSLMAGVLAFSQWVAARETQPLRVLAAVAERIGRDRGQVKFEDVKVNVRNTYEVATLSDALNRMQGRIQAFLDERTLMLGALSHDLRTPLTRMRLGADSVAAPELRAEFVADIEEMRMMVEAALNFARGEAVGEDERPTDLAVMARSLCDDLSDRGGVASFDGADHCIVDCQPLAVKRALANLIDNAWKFAGGAQVSLGETDAGVTIDVADQGPGIPPDRIDDAFAPFRRLEGDASGKPGAGLGLTIARDVALAHGGALTLLANHPHGLRAVLSLPRRRGPAKA